ncbi:DUF6461 domain-containing protein [Streptomyces sp. NPDC012403]|uniref:DUF6461 domain-containing protein n=1 Tax=Streptomyces sp. NPDC012403 TaxID=3364831 RepID=UPI0036E3D998
MRSGPGATARSAPTAHPSTAHPDQRPTDPHETADVVTAVDLFHWYKAGELRTSFERPTDRSGSASDVLVAEYHLPTRREVAFLRAPRDYGARHRRFER